MYSYDILIEHDCDGKGQGGLMGGGDFVFGVPNNQWRWGSKLLQSVRTQHKNKLSIKVKFL